MFWNSSKFQTSDFLASQKAVVGLRIVVPQGTKGIRSIDWVITSPSEGLAIYSREINLCIFIDMFNDGLLVSLMGLVRTPNQ